MLSPDFTPARYQVLTTSRFDFPNTAVFKILFQKHGKQFSLRDGIRHFWGSRVSCQAAEKGSPAGSSGKQRSFIHFNACREFDTVPEGAWHLLSMPLPVNTYSVRNIIVKKLDLSCLMHGIC